MTTAIAVYREPGWFAGELRRAFGLKALGVTDEDVVGIVADADFHAQHERVPLSDADRALLRSELLAEAYTSMLRWFEPSRGYAPRTYANSVMNTHQPKIVARILDRQANEPTILDAPVDAGDPMSPAFVDKEPDTHEHRHLMRCLPLCDWEMVMAFFTSEEFAIFEARLHNVPREAIRRELDYSPGVWKRVWRSFQRRAAFILDLERK